MLPFLKNKNQAGLASIIIKNRQPDEKVEENQEDSHDSAIEECANRLISAVHSHDAKSVADAMREAFEILEKLSHKEIKHENDEIKE